MAGPADLAAEGPAAAAEEAERDRDSEVAEGPDRGFSRIQKDFASGLTSIARGPAILSLGDALDHPTHSL